MIPAYSRTRQHHAVGMERRGCDGGVADVVQEAAIWLEGIEEGAVDVEDVDVVAFCAADITLAVSNTQFKVGAIKS